MAKGPTLKTFTLRLKNQQEVEKINRFISQCVFEDQTPRQVVMEMVRNYLKTHADGLDLVTEKEATDRARNLGWSTTRDSIKMYRKRGLLKDDTGPWFFTDTEGHVRYDWKRLKPFLKERSKNRYKRMKQ